MNTTNPGLAEILSNLRDCNRTYVNVLNRVAESASNAADHACSNPYADCLGAQLVAQSTRLGGERDGLVSAAKSVGGNMDHIKIALSGDRATFYELFDALRAN